MESASSVLLSLPPLEKMDAKPVLDAAATLPGYSDADKTAWEQKTCVTNETPATGALADALSGEVQKYLEKQYGGDHKPTKYRYVVLNGDKAGALKLFTYAELLEPHKSQSGYWASEFTFDGSSKWQGSLLMHVHYYEGSENNVQYRATRTVPATTFQGTPMDAKGMVGNMRKAVNALHSHLIDISDTAVQASMKKVRRILPITKTRMKWDDAAQNAVKVLKKSVNDKSKTPLKPFGRK
mmetsp:Transcript_6863/g.8894  ORF Transcript_6863/g.8894 Transcript_6863/m.8894 type:complete len:239 (+) Transcript_6863:111-827(+)